MEPEPTNTPPPETVINPTAQPNIPGQPVPATQPVTGPTVIQPQTTVIQPTAAQLQPAMPQSNPVQPLTPQPGVMPQTMPTPIMNGPSANSAKKSKKKLIVGIVVAVILAIVVAAGLFFYGI